MGTRTGRLLAGLGMILLVVSLASAAVAQPAKDKATALAKAAVVLLEEGKLDEAQSLFEKAYKLDPAPVLLGHLGKLWDRKGNLAKAREYYQRWVAAETDPDRQAKARARLGELLDRMPGKLVVTATPAGAAVTVDGRPVAAGTVVELPKGSHVVEATLKGHAPGKRTAEVEAGREVRVAVELLPLPGRLDVRGGPAGARVTVNGTETRRLPLDRPYVLPPGRHVLEVTADGYEKWVRTVEVGPDATATVAVGDLVAQPKAAVPVAKTPAPSPAASRAPGDTRPVEGVAARGETRSSPWPWVSIGTGAAALVVGAVMTGMAYRERSAVSDASREGDVITGVTRESALDHVSKARTYDTASYVMYGVGGAAVVTGIVLWATQPKAGKSASNHVPAIGAAPAPGGGSVAMAWRF